MTEHDTTLDLSTNATVAVGLALVAVAALGGGALVTGLDSAQVGFFVSGGNPVGSAVGGGVGGLLGLGSAIGITVATDSMPALQIAGPVGAAVGAGIGAL